MTPQAVISQQPGHSTTFQRHENIDPLLWGPTNYNDLLPGEMGYRFSGSDDPADRAPVEANQSAAGMEHGQALADFSGCDSIANDASSSSRSRKRKSRRDEAEDEEWIKAQEPRRAKDRCS